MASGSGTGTISSGLSEPRVVPNLFWRELPFDPDRQVVGLRIAVPFELMTQDRIRHATSEGPPPQFGIGMPHQCSRTGANPGELLSQFSHLAGSFGGTNAAPLGRLPESP